MSEPTLGERLKAEREKRGLSTQKAADDLHLDPWVIEALEAGDYARIGPSVYAKGYLRKYASVLGVPVGELSVAEPRLAAMSPPAAAPVMRVADGHGTAPGGRLGLVGPLLAFTIVALASALAWWHPWRSRPAAADAAGPTAGASRLNAGTGNGAGAAADEAV